MAFTDCISLSYAERLETYRGYWDGNETAARQLSAVGHVCDRPPIEALEDGSHCISCNAFVKREDSIKALEGPLSPASVQDDCTLRLPTLHHPNCIRLQVRIPVDSQTALTGSLGSLRVNDVRNMWERRSKPAFTPEPVRPRVQNSSLFSLPTEIRLEIYSMVLPMLDEETIIVPLHRDSARIVTLVGAQKTGPRDMTKINLLSTCRAVYEEAVDILFTSIAYRFDSTKVLYLFLRHIGQLGRQLIKSVDVTCGQREDAIAFALLASCPKLKTITIRLNRPVLMRPPAPIWIADGVATLLELSGLENVHFGKSKLPTYMDETKADAVIIRRELTRPRGKKGGVRWVNGFLDL